MSQDQILEPLPYPVYFVFQPITRELQAVLEQLNDRPVEDILDQIFQDNYKTKVGSAPINWSLQPYIQLKRRGLDVRLVSEYVPGQICVVPYDYLSTRGFPFNAYIVACQYDRGRPEICEQRVIQNKLNAITPSDHFLPHWPQPKLKIRDQSRGSLIETLAYKGREHHLAPAFKSPEFLGELRSLNINFSFSDCESGLQRAWLDWSDYKTSDVVLAVRNSSDYHLSFKPASKLINAWFAGCPALLGPESAFQQLRESELDYIEVRSPGDVISALRQLQEKPGLYEAMVENGFRRAKGFTPDAISSLWRNVLAGSIASGYEHWLHQPKVWKLFGRPTQFAWRAMKHRRTSQYFWDQVRNAPKTFSE